MLNTGDAERMRHSRRACCEGCRTSLEGEDGTHAATLQNRRQPHVPDEWQFQERILRLLRRGAQRHPHLLPALFRTRLQCAIRRETQQSNGARVIDIELKNEEDIYQYTIKVFDNGNSSIDVQSRQRDHISYSGEMVFGESKQE